jgi:hypothetical protein
MTFGRELVDLLTKPFMFGKFFVHVFKHPGLTVANRANDWSLELELATVAKNLTKKIKLNY